MTGVNRESARCRELLESLAAHSVVAAKDRRRSADHAATSTARFGPERTATGLLGNYRARISVMRRPVPCSIPLVQLSRTVSSFRTTSRIVLRYDRAARGGRDEDEKIRLRTFGEVAR